MARFVPPLAGLLLAGAAVASPAAAGDYGYGPPPSGRAIAPYDAPYAGPGYPAPAEPGFLPPGPPPRVSGRRVRVYPETGAGIPPGPFVVAATVEPVIAPGLLYNTPPTPEAYAYAPGAIRVRY